MMVARDLCTSDGVADRNEVGIDHPGQLDHRGRPRGDGQYDQRRESFVWRRRQCRHETTLGGHVRGRRQPTEDDLKNPSTSVDAQ